MLTTFRIINVEDLTCSLTSVFDPQDFALFKVHTGNTIPITIICKTPKTVIIMETL